MWIQKDEQRTTPGIVEEVETMVREAEGGLEHKDVTGTTAIRDQMNIEGRTSPQEEQQQPEKR